MSSAGERLKEARQKKGLTIEGASAFTKIQPKLLKALEDEEFHKLPDKVYVRAFLKKYASYLGLDPESLIRQLEKSKVLASQQVVHSQPKDEAAGRQPIKRPLNRKKAARLLIAIAALFFVVNFFRGGCRPEAPAVEKGAPSGPLRLSVRAIGDCRLSVTADGRLLFEDFMLKGTKEAWQAREKFSLDVSDMSAVRLTLNGRRLRRPGKGPVRDFVITP